MRGHFNRLQLTDLIDAILEEKPEGLIVIVKRLHTPVREAHKYLDFYRGTCLSELGNSILKSNDTY